MNEDLLYAKRLMDKKKKEKEMIPIGEYIPEMT